MLRGYRKRVGGKLSHARYSGFSVAWMNFFSIILQETARSFGVFLFGCAANTRKIGRMLVCSRCLFLTAIWDGFRCRMLRRSTGSLNILFGNPTAGLTLRPLLSATNIFLICWKTWSIGKYKPPSQGIILPCFESGRFWRVAMRLIATFSQTLHSGRWR